MSENKADTVVRTTVSLQRASDRVYDCFVEARQYSASYGECKLRCIAVDQPVDVVATVQYNDGDPVGAYEIRLAGSFVLLAHQEISLPAIAVANSDLGLVATVVGVQAVMSYTTWEPEDDNIEFCTELLYQLCATEFFNGDAPVLELITDFESDADEVKYTGAVRLRYEGGDTDRIEVQVSSRPNATCVAVFSLSFDSDGQHTNSFMETDLGDATSDALRCMQVVAARLASEIASHSAVIE